MVQSWMKSMGTICSSHKYLYRDFLSTRPTRLGEPPLVSLLLWSRGGLVIEQRTTTRLLGAHCRHSLSEVARQCEADMSGKSVPHQEDTRELETRRPRLPRLYIYSLESNQLSPIYLLIHIDTTHFMNIYIGIVII